MRASEDGSVRPQGRGVDQETGCEVQANKNLRWIQAWSLTAKYQALDFFGGTMVDPQPTHPNSTPLSEVKKKEPLPRPPVQSEGWDSQAELLAYLIFGELRDKSDQA